MKISNLDAYPDGRFHTVLADPPWPSKSSSKRDSFAHRMRPRYQTMKAIDIAALPVDRLAAKDAVLVLWSTWMHLPLALHVMGAWGFDYATGMPWLKVIKLRDECVEYRDNCVQKLEAAPIYGPGPWFQHCTELVLIGRRGHPFGALGNPRPARKGIVIAPRGEHSTKPEEVQAWVDAKLPGPRLELFARKERKGWTQWGDEL